MRILVLALAFGATMIAAATCSAARVVVHPPRLAGLTTSTSVNWSGYAVDGGPFKNVSASWVQPTVTCAPGETSYSSFWVGLDGDTSNTVEQIGTDSDCVNGAPTYFAWDELYPKLPATLVTVAPGDTIGATVTTDGKGNFTLTITANGESTTVQGKDPRAALNSAEVIAEAPASNNGPYGELGLANFGSVSFSNASVDSMSLGGLNPEEITMVQGGTTLAQPSSISGNGAFSVKFDAPSGPSTHRNGHRR